MAGGTGNQISSVTYEMHLINYDSTIVLGIDSIIHYNIDAIIKHNAYTKLGAQAVSC